MRRMFFFAFLLAAAFPAASAADSAGAPGLLATLSVSSDFATVNYTVRNTSTRSIKAGRIVFFGTSGGWPLKYRVPIRWKMNGLKAVPFNDIYRVLLPGFIPGQAVRFSVTYSKKDVRPKPTCHYILFKGYTPARKCNVKI